MTEQQERSDQPRLSAHQLDSILADHDALLKELREYRKEIADLERRICNRIEAIRDKRAANIYTKEEPF